MIPTVLQWLALILALLFAAGGIVNLLGPEAVRQGYARWGYPPAFRYVTGTLNLLAGVLLPWPACRQYGAVLAVLVTIAALATLAWHREWNHALPGVILLGAAAILL